MHLLIRADASTQMGTGHLTRCLALAQAWQAQGRQATFITVCESDVLRQRLSNEGFRVIRLEQPYPAPADWEITSQALNAPNTWLVLDGYHFDSDYQRRIKQKNARLLVIDDMAHLEHYYADIVLNQNIGAARLAYSCEPYTKLLLGSRYVLLRPEFLNWKKRQRNFSQPARKLLVTLGGGDFDNQTLKVIGALQSINVSRLEIVVVVGPSNPHFRELELATHKSAVPIRLVRNVTNMAELMAWADIAISAGGSTCWELAFMGLPTIILILAENQRGVAEGLHTLGAAINVGWFSEVDELALAQALKTVMFDSTRRKAMSEAGQRLIDGTGATRVVSVMGKLTSPTSILDNRLGIRRAGSKDLELLWQWANDPEVRANSFHPEPIPFQEHVQWYQGKLNSPDTRIWIIELDQLPVAQIRYDRVDGDTVEVGFSVASDFRGIGLGTKTLALTHNMACRELNVTCVKGIVFCSNKASQRVFTKAGFERISQEYISNILCDIFVKSLC